MKGAAAGTISIEIHHCHPTLPFLFARLVPVLKCGQRHTLFFLDGTILVCIKSLEVSLVECELLRGHHNAFISIAQRVRMCRKLEAALALDDVSQLKKVLTLDLERIDRVALEGLGQLHSDKARAEDG